MNNLNESSKPVVSQVYVSRKSKDNYEDYVMVTSVDGDTVTYINPFRDEVSTTAEMFNKKYKKGSQSDYDVFEEVDGVQFISILGNKYPILTEGSNAVVCADDEGNKFKVDKSKLDEGVYSDIDIEIQEIESIDHGIKGLNIHFERNKNTVSWDYTVDGKTYRLGYQFVGSLDKFNYINSKPTNVKMDKKGIQNLLKRYVGSMITWLKNQSKTGLKFASCGIQSSPILCLYILDHLGPEVGKPIDKALVESIVEVVNGNNVIPTARDIVTKTYSKQIKYLEDKYKVKF